MLRRRISFQAAGRTPLVGWGDPVGRADARYLSPRSLGTFMLDSSNVAVTSMALGIGVAGAAVIEVLW
jgi:hypothetical protein